MTDRTIRVDEDTHKALKKESLKQGRYIKTIIKIMVEKGEARNGKQ